ncbi:MAG: hypothetical protein C4K60_16105 [Ideonella sp. MAG2]|nr:MAG: hypothetical protein C4K60_16105 [Ideonella sp. MAG2]
MNCRPHCAACCTAPSISSPIPGMPHGEAVAFQRLDQRLATCLLGRGSPITTTHQALADELGTVREMVTRLLKRFEQAGWLQLGRERITVLDARALRELAQGPV